MVLSSSSVQTLASSVYSWQETQAAAASLEESEEESGSEEETDASESSESDETTAEATSGTDETTAEASSGTDETTSEASSAANETTAEATSGVDESSTSVRSSGNETESGTEETEAESETEGTSETGTEETSESETEETEEVTLGAETSALIAYADSLFGKNGTAQALKLTVSQTPGSGTILAGDTISWALSLTNVLSANYKYEGFSSSTKTMYSTYASTVVTFKAPDGVTFKSATTSGLEYTISEDGKTLTVNFGDISAESSSSTAITVSAVVDTGTALATGTTISLSQENISYTTEITILDRDNNSAEVKTYTVTGNTTTNVSEYALTTTSEDVWEVSKSANGTPTEISEGILCASYEVELLLDGSASWSTYTQNGRVGFAALSLTDVPTVTGEDGNVYPYYIEIIPANFTGETVTAGSKDDSTGTVTSVSITSYATPATLLEKQSALDGIDQTLPVYSVYTVNVYYAGDFSSDFYDEDSYTVENTVNLAYTLAYVTGTTPVTRSDSASSESVTYKNVSQPAVVNLEKYIDSIFGGGEYTTLGSDDFTGSATFTILDSGGNAASLYILTDEGEYQAIENTIVFTEEGMYVTKASTGVVATLLSALLGSETLYSGSLYLEAGTYTIQETKNKITNTSTGTMTSSDLTLSEDEGVYTFTVAAGDTRTIQADNVDTRGGIQFHKYSVNYDGSGQANLAGVTFTLYSDAACTQAVAVKTAVSTSEGLVSFPELETGTYYIKETETVEGYLLDETIYSAVVTSNTWTTSLTNTETEETSVSSVSNRKNSASLTLQKYLLSIDTDGKIERVAVDASRLSLFATAFTLQVSTDGGVTWTDYNDDTYGLIRTQTGTELEDGTVATEDSSYLTISGLKVYQDDGNPYYYRIVETLPKDYTGYDTTSYDTLTDGRIATKGVTLVGGDGTVSLTNVTTGEATMAKQYYAMLSSNTNGVTARYAGYSDDFPAITGYICTLNDDGTYTVVNSGKTEVVEETSADGTSTTTRSLVTLYDLPLLDNDGKPQAYYWAEETSTNGVSYTLEGGTEATVLVDGVKTTMYVSTTAVYAAAYDSENNAETLTNILPYRRITLRKYAVYGDQSTTDALSGAYYTVYRVVDGKEETEPYTQYGYKYADRSIAPTGVNLVLEIGYEYHIYETIKPANTSGLKDKNGEDIDYLTVDLTKATAATQTEINTTFGSYVFYDEPYRKVQLTKYLVSQSGAQALDSTATFQIYVSDTGEDYSWTLYTTTLYTANGTVELQPGKYYAFVETEQDGILSPEEYLGETTAESGTIITKEGKKYLGFLIEDLPAGKELYEIETVYNYTNLGTLEVRKYRATIDGTGSQTPVEGAKITIYRSTSENAQISDCEIVGTYTTGADGILDLADLPVYDDQGNLYYYYIQETGNPSGYFLCEDILTATLTPCAVTSTGTDGNTLILYDEPEVMVNVQVTWENCYEADQAAASGSTEQDYLANLGGATVAAYRKVTDEYGNVTYEYVKESTSSSETGYAVFTGLSWSEEYVFVLVSSGVTSETTDNNYPLYASEDGSLVYLENTASHPTLTVDELASYSYVSYQSSGEDSYTFSTTENGGNLNNHLLYTQVSALKYCTVLDGHTSDTYTTITIDGVKTEVALVNGSTFVLYRQELTAEQIAQLEAEVSVEIPYDITKLETVYSMESGAGGELGQLTFNSVTYGSMYVYWLVETSPAASHSWPAGSTYYRVLLYADDWSTAGVTSADATETVAYTKNEIQEFAVPNIHSTGSPHEYFRTYLYMNKWQSSYDEYGNVIEGADSPLGGASFKFWLSNTAMTTKIALFDGQATESMSASSSLGYLNPGSFVFADLFNDWLTEIAQTEEGSVESVADITTEILDKVSADTWTAYSGMLYAATEVDEADLADLIDLAANNGTVAKIFLAAYNAEYAGTWSTSNMENVMASEGTLGATYGYAAYFAHITFKESAAPANFLLNETEYEIYLQFQSTGSSGSANTKYFYLDGNYYTTDPSGIGSSVSLDNSLSNEGTLANAYKIEITNLADPEYSVTITKYGYTLNDETIGKTDSELDTYFTGTSVGSQRTALSDTTFRLQRYDAETGTWKYYTYDSTAGSGEYVDSLEAAMEITTGENGYVVVSLPIGYYRLIETGTKDSYQTILDGNEVDGVTAARYFWVQDTATGNSVNVYDPLAVTLTVEKETLGASGNSVDGVTITLTDTSSKKTYTETISGGTATFYYLPAGTYTVSETVDDSLQVTGAYFKEFTITVGYELAANTDGEVYIESLLYEIGKDAAGTVCAYGEADTLTAGSGFTEIVLTLHNPSKGELTITKVDKNSPNTALSASTYQATFELYFKAFDSFADDDSYEADLSNPPKFDSSTYETDGWTKLDKEYTTVGGKIRITDLTPGWYAVVETKAPTYYELADPVVTCVRGDMTENHTYVADAVSVSDTKKTTITVSKYFELSDFYSELYSTASGYKVTFGLYVQDTEGNYYYASDLGLATSKTVTVTTSYTSGTSMRNSSWWYLQVVQMGEALDADRHYLATVTQTGKEVTLDGKYYIREDSVKDSSENDISGNWWLSSVSFTESGTSAVTRTANEDGYYELSGFSKNHTGTVTFTNNYSYARVIIQKTGNNGTVLTGATFGIYTKDDSGKLEKVAESTDNGDGSYTFLVPTESLTETTYYIYEETAPDHYMLNETYLTVDLKSGDIKTYGTDTSLIMEDSNGVNLILTKYDNIYANRSQAALLDGVTFTLFRRVKDASSGNWGDWEMVEEGTTGADGNSTGLVVFDTVSIDTDSYQYMIAETSWNTNKYVGIESLYYYGNTAIVNTEKITYNGKTYTGYILPLTEADIGADYALTAYNQPILNVTFKKVAADTTSSTVPTATLAAYQIDSSAYQAGQTLTEAEITTLCNTSTLVDTDTTTASLNGYSQLTMQLPAGTYLVVETAAGSGYVIDKDDAREVWYQVVEVTVPTDGSKSLTVEDAFVNVYEKYDLTLTKTSATTTLDDDLLSTGANISYTLDLDVTSTGPLNDLILAEEGLTATKVYEDVEATTGTALDSSDREKYLKGQYAITSVVIPTDASYNYSNLVFSSGDSSSFTPQIRVKVTFTYEDDSTEEQSVLLANVSGDTWTVTPGGSGNAVSFTVEWYDTRLAAETGYELGSSFTVSKSGQDIQVNVAIEQQVSGTTDFYALAEFVNDASVSYQYTSWDASGENKTASEEDSAEYAITVPNVEAPELTIAKTVENITSPSRDISGDVITGDTLEYTLTLTNQSASLGMDDPILIDLLPRGLDIDAATDTSWAAGLTIVGTSDLTIGNVEVYTTEEGYTMLLIRLKGTLAARASVQLSLTGTVGNSIVNYIANSMTLTNTVYVTSDQKGTVYHDNETGSLFKGNTGDWAGDIGSGTQDKVVKAILEEHGFTGYGYLSAAATIDFTSTYSVSLLKEVQGDQDGSSWYSGTTGGSVTANSSGTTDDDGGYANFRLTVNNADQTKELVDLVVLDVIPKEGDNYDFSGTRNSKWSLDYAKITSVQMVNTTTGASTDVSADDYTIWYYTGTITADTITAWEQAVMDVSAANLGSGWTTTAPTDLSTVTAFLLQFDQSVTIQAGYRLVVTYQTTVPEMTDEKIDQVAHYATYNSFSTYYKYVNNGSTNYDNAEGIDEALTSNEVFALLETTPVQVGGMFWIDADGDGLQEPADVTDVTSYAGYETFNKRTNTYAGYKSVQALLETASMRLLTYTGAQQGATQSSSLTLEGDSWRYLFTNLTTANLLYPTADTSTNYTADGVIWSRLAGDGQAATYVLQAVIEGNVGVKYSLTSHGTGSSGLGAVLSYDPAALYGDTSYTTYWDNVLRDSNFTAETTTSTTGSLTATSERFFLHAGTSQYNLAEDIGLVLYRDLEITKTDSLGQNVEGVTFDVYGPYDEGEAAKVDVSTLSTSSTNHVATVTTGSDGKALVSDLLYFQKYIIVESDASSGYDLAGTTASGTNITKRADGVWILSIPTKDESQKENTTDPTAFNTVNTDHMSVTNALKTGTLTFSKTEIGNVTATNGDPVSGATFTLSCDTETVSGAWSSWVSYITDRTSAELAAMGLASVTSDGSTITFVTSFSGSVNEVNLSNLPYGTYTLTETKAATGYTLGEITTWKVVIGDTTVLSYEKDNVDVEVTNIDNTYTPSGSLTLYAQKTEENYESTKTYTFELYEADKNWTVATAVATATGTGAGTAAFSSITYDAEGTYYYVLREVIPSNTEYITYDTSEYGITVKVTDSDAHDGTLNATVTDVVKMTTDGTETLVASGTDSTYTAAFTNTYTATGELTVNVSKTVTDSAGNTYTYAGIDTTDSAVSNYISNLEFTFALAQGTQTLQTVTITGDELFNQNSTYGAGTFEELFETITYSITDVGRTFTYTVTETVGLVNGVLPTGYTENQQSYTITVTLADNGNNTLAVTVVVRNSAGVIVYNTETDSIESKVTTDGIDFTNIYSPSGATSLTIGKKLNGGTTIPANTFEVELAELALDGSQKPYQTDGDWVTGSSGSALAYVGTDGTVTFLPTASYETTDLDTAVYSALNYTTAGVHWYLVTESQPSASNGYRYDDTEYLVKITVTDGGTGTLTAAEEVYTYNEKTEEFVAVNDTSNVSGALLTFRNTTTTSYSVEKVWDDNDNNNDTRPESISVTLQRSTDGTTWTDVGTAQTLSNENSWIYNWESLDAYTESGDSYTYRVVETVNGEAVASGGTVAGAHNSAYSVSYTNNTTLTDGTTGTEITNTLQTGKLEVTKTVTGSGGSTTQSFTFHVTFTLNDSPLVGSYAYTKTTASGTSTGESTLNSSGSLTFTLAHGESMVFSGLPAGTEYTVTEDSVTGYKTTYTNTDATGTVTTDTGAAGTISTDGTSTAACTNYYAEGALTLTGSKTVTGMPTGLSLAFGFTVTRESDDETVATGTATATANGTAVSFDFSPISYTLEDLTEDGTITYLITENIPGDAVNGVYNGITYDQTVYRVVVTLTDNGAGTLSAVITSVTKVSGNERAKRDRVDRVYRIFQQYV